MVGGGGGVPVASQITITLAKYDFTSRYEQFLELLIHTDGLSDHADTSFSSNITPRCGRDLRLDQTN